ncbi:MAG: bifunctional metallophosphatase/5'-nucleotidase [Myxococcales bacterium]|nr:bifunctional metallophosphatase/5'-nucleotidase [Myxococcales bacterium]
MTARLGALLLVVACAPKPPPAVQDGPHALTVLHTNDIHAHFEPEPAEWLDGRPAIGGFVRLEQEVRTLRAARGKDHTLTLDGGDQLTGTPITEIEVEGSFGGAMHALFDEVGYDAWVIGNHEFDKGLENISRYVQNHPTLPLSSNLLKPGSATPLLPQQEKSHIFDIAGMRVGVIGVTTDRLAGLMNKGDFALLTLLPEAQAVQAEVDLLDPQTDLIVVLSHIGVERDQTLASEVSGIDLIVGAHSHTRLTSALRIGDTYVVQAGSHNRSLGIVDLVEQDDRITEFRYELRDLLPNTATVAPDPEIQGLVATYKASVDRVYGERVSEATGLLGRSYNHESALGRWITDALRDRSGADIALYNGGGLRADLAEGPVTRLVLFQCFPFQNPVMQFRLTGQQVLGLVLQNIAADADEKRGFLSTSGLTWTWRRNVGAPELVTALVGGQPLHLTRMYTLVASSYVTEQWQKHLGGEAQPQDLEPLGYTDFDVAVEYARKHPVVDPGDIRGAQVE